MMPRALAAGLWLGLASAAAAAELPSTCPPAPLIGEAEPLPALAAVLRPGATLAVLAVGSASVFGPEASLAPGSTTSEVLSEMGAAPATPAGRTTPPATDGGFVRQMAHALQQQIPGLHVTVTVRGGLGMAAPVMLGILRQELSRQHYQLVIWQTGTVEAVQDAPPGDFYETLADGAAYATSAGAAVVLVDPQFSRFLEANANLEDYESAFQAVSTMPDVVLFHRRELMRGWAEQGGLDLERAPRSQRLAQARRLHACLGHELARTLLADTAG